VLIALLGIVNTWPCRCASEARIGLLRRGHVAPPGTAPSPLEAVLIAVFGTAMGLVVIRPRLGRCPRRRPGLKLAFLCCNW
jgi:hypothetical protein